MKTSGRQSWSTYYALIFSVLVITGLTASFVSSAYQKLQVEDILGFRLIAALTAREVIAYKDSGYIDKTGRFAYHIWPRENSYSYSEGLSRRSLSEFVDKKGKVALQLNGRFMALEDFSEGLAVVSELKKQGGKYGFIDKKGNCKIAPQYEAARSFHESLAPVKVNGHWGFINKSGDLVIAPDFDDVLRFRQGVAAVSLNKKVGYIDRSGRFLVMPQFDAGMSFNEGLAKVVNFKAASGVADVRYIDKSGKTVFDLQQVLKSFDPSGENVKLASSLSSLSKPFGLNGTIDRSTAYPYPFYCDSSHPDFFSSERLLFCAGGRRGYLDKRGRIAIPANYDSAQPFSEGLAAVAIGRRYGYIDNSGQFAIEPRFEEASDFHEGLAFVREWSGKSGFIDRAGKITIVVKCGSAEAFHDGLARVGPMFCYP